MALLQRQRLIHVTTVPQTLRAFFHGQVDYMKSRGFEVMAISSPGPILEEVGERENIPVYGVPMVRGISPFADLVALFRLWRLFRRLKPAIVHCHTAKASLLSMLAATLALVPVRIYSLLGFLLEARKGFLKHIFRLTEQITCFCAHRIISVSPSMSEAAVREHICPAHKIKVLTHGSANGIDTKRFDPKNVSSDGHKKFCSVYGIPENALVIGFIGRVVRDKGVHELIGAWNTLKEEFPELHLLIVGPFEAKDPLDPLVKKQIQNDPRIHFTGWLEDTVTALAAMDILVLPTYREGFGNVMMEASAMEVPVVATRVTGCVDAVEEGVSGFLVPHKDSEALADATRILIKSPETRIKMGKAGRERAVRDFKPEDLWEALYREYVGLLREKGIQTERN